MRFPPEIDQASIVILGRFNPSIFQPWWFAQNDIIGKEEAHNAEIEIIHPEFCKFQTEHYLIQVEAHRFQATSNSWPMDLVNDLTMKTFNDFLSHTPCWTLGINRLIHIDTGSISVRNALGKELAPWEPWGEWGEMFNTSNKGQSDGMISLRMLRYSDEQDNYSGYVATTISPSSKITDNKGIHININNHYDVINREDAVDCIHVLTALENQWKVAMDHSEFIVDQLMKRVEALNYGD
jgi:hypothetical protein